MSKPKFSWIGRLILIAIAFRLILAPFYFHPDLKIIYYIAHFLPSGVVNIWDFLEANPDLNILGQFVYPPLTYFLFGSFYALISPLAGPHLDQWLQMGNTAVEVQYILRYQLLTKLPLLLIDVSAVFVIYKFFERTKKAKLAAIIWAFNPFSLYSATLMGQFDIIPAVLTLVALYLAHKHKKLLYAAILIGLASSLKTYAILFLPALVLANSESWTIKLRILLIGLASYLLTILPFISSSAFRQSVLFSDLGQRIFSAGLDFGFNDGIIIAPTLIIFLYLYTWHKKLNQILLPELFTAITLITLSLSHFHPQWFTWAAPFLLILLVRNLKLWPIFALMVIFFVLYILFYDDLFLNLGLLSPLNPEVYNQSAPSIHFDKIYSSRSIVHLVHSGILATSALIIFSSFKHNPDETQ